MIWQCPSMNLTMTEAINNFASCYWPEKREAEKSDNGYFKIVDGIATYHCELENGIYLIRRLESAAH